MQSFVHLLPVGDDVLGVPHIRKGNLKNEGTDLYVFYTTVRFIFLLYSRDAEDVVPYKF